MPNTPPKVFSVEGECGISELSMELSKDTIELSGYCHRCGSALSIPAAHLYDPIKRQIIEILESGLAPPLDIKPIEGDEPLNTMPWEEEWLR